MYRGFNLKINFKNNDYYKQGLFIFKHMKAKVRTILSDFAFDDRTLNGAKMQKNWFPEVKAKIFISHSHKDKKLAITLAGWLYEEFGIIAFIDSCIWGCSDELLKIIDKKYCRQPNSNTYNYQQRNFSTSHIHMMLSTALSMMIDKTECLFFINTPSSISTEEVIDNTESPWIYFEISISQIIRQKTPSRLSKESLERNFSRGLEWFTIKHEVDLAHLTKLNNASLNLWSNTFTKTLHENPHENPLDTLYKLNNLTET